MRYSSLLLALLTSVSMAGEPLRLHPQNPRYLEFRGKPTVLITSGEHYGAVLNLDFDFVPYLAELEGKSLNLTRTFSGTYREVPGSFGITDNTLAPKPGRYIAPWVEKDGKFDLSQFNPAYFDRLKKFLAEADKRGVVVEYVLFCTLYDDGLWAANAMNPKNNVNRLPAIGRREVFTLQHKELQAYQDAFVRKAVEELNGFDNVYFEICNEPYFENVTDEWQAHIAQVIADAQKDKPRKHLIAQNIANGQKKVEKPNPNVSIFNFHYATPPETVALNAHLNRPIGDDETGFKGKDDVHYRTEGWDFLIAGGAIYSSLDYSFTPGHPAGTLTDFKSPGGGGTALRTQLSHLKRFLDSFDLVNLKPANHLVKGGTVTAPLTGAPARAPAVTIRCLAKEGQEYALYLRGGSRADFWLELPDGEYKVEWLNPRTGQIDKKDTIAVRGEGKAKLVSPDYAEDCAVRVVRE